MPYERRDPIPPGYYWMDTPTKKQREALTAWIRRFTPRVKRVKQTTGGTWSLFKVTDPVPRWGRFDGLGYPNIAKKGASTSKDDTVQKPPKNRGILDDWDAPGNAYKAGFGTGIGALVLLYLLTRR